MTRLIDADALIEKYGNWYVKDTEEYTQWGFVGSLRTFLKEQPTVDAVPVIRCEDCKYGHVRALTKDGTVKGMWCDDSAMYTLKQWCSRAERKEDKREI